MLRSLSEIEADLRRAVLSQSYSELQRLIMLFCEAVEAHVRALARDDASIPEICSMAQETLQWTSSMVRLDRETLALQLKLIPRVKPYLQLVNSAPTMLRVDV